MADGSATHGLKLRVTDDEDLKVASCCLQDALVPVLDMCFQRGEQRFVMVCNRFKWEEESLAEPLEVEGEAESERVFQRTNCGVLFEKVRAVKCRGVSPLERGQILELLAIEREGPAVLLHFAGGACLRLETEGLDARLEDIGECWPTVNRPCHTLDAEPLPEPVRAK
jgi:hypothetical protein